MIQQALSTPVANQWWQSLTQELDIFFSFVPVLTFWHEGSLSLENSMLL